MKADIQQDLPRLTWEEKREADIDYRVAESLKKTPSPNAFNILTGEGHGSRPLMEFRPVGKRIVNPSQSMHSIFAEHGLDARNRQLQSKHRFFTYPWNDTKQNRAEQMKTEGFIESKKETMIIGCGSGQPRCKLRSQGASDNYAHLRVKMKEPDYEKRNKTKSQIIFG
jgi:hypothetical protein